MGLAHEKKSYLQEKANLFEIGSLIYNLMMILQDSDNNNLYLSFIKLLLRPNL